MKLAPDYRQLTKLIDLFQFSRYPEKEDVREWNNYIAQINKILDLCKTEGLLDKRLVQLLHKAGQYSLYQIGDFEFAEKYLIEAISALEQLSPLQESDPASWAEIKKEEAFIYNTWGRVYLDRFDLNNNELSYVEKAWDFYSRSFALKQQLYSEDQPDYYYTEGTKHSLGRVKLAWAIALMPKDETAAQTQLQEARELFEQVIKYRAQEKFAGDSAKQVFLGQSYGEYAQVLTLQNDLAAAEEFFNKSISVLEQNLGKTYNDVAWVIHRFGYFFIKKPDYQQALAQFIKAINIYDRHYTSEGQQALHPRVRHVLNDIEKLFQEQAELTLPESEYFYLQKIYERLHSVCPDFYEARVSSSSMSTGVQQTLLASVVTPEPTVASALAKLEP